MHLTIDSYLIVQAECCRTWPVALGITLGKCGLCRTTPVVTNPLVVIREPVVHSEEEEPDL